MSTVCVSLLGRLQVQCGSFVMQEFESRKAQELFCYLAIHRSRPHARETLANVLWAEASTIHAKKYLRQAVWQLQTLLQQFYEEDRVETLSVEPEWIGIRPDAGMWTDVAQLEDAYTDTQAVLGEQFSELQAHQVQDAVQLYHGDLLEGWYQDWCIFERERLQGILLILLDKLIDYAMVHENFEGALQYGIEILRCDRARERTHRRLMKLYYLAGDRTAALRQYESCVEALEEELSVSPARSTQVLYKQICTDNFEGICATQPVFQYEKADDPQSHNVAPSRSDLPDQLRQIQANLLHLQHQVEECLNSYQQTLKRN
jgi:DNA-binding SARP family transcriptional activator